MECTVFKENQMNGFYLSGGAISSHHEWLEMVPLEKSKAGFFFFMVAKKLKHFFSQKLKVPEDFSKSMGKKLNLRVFSNKILSQNGIFGKKSVF